MLTPEDDIIIKQETSCSKEEAIAKLIGWMRGTLRKRYVEFSTGWISEEQLPYLYSLHGTVQEHLQDLRNAAYFAYHDAAVVDIEPDTIVEEKRQSVARIDQLIRDAASYLQGIEKEFDRGDASVLKIDREATERSGVIQLSLNSLDQWAHKQYGFSIFEPPSLPSVTEIPAEKTKSDRTEPWWTFKEGDPKPKEPWYTPARYFARELVRDDTTLLKKRDLLAEKVAQSLTAVGIYKRGGKSPFGTGTILKSFSNVILR